MAVEDLTIDIDVAGNFESQLSKLASGLRNVKREARGVDRIDIDVLTSGEEYAATAISGLTALANDLEDSYQIDIGTEGVERALAQLEAANAFDVDDKLLNLDVEGQAEVFAAINAIEGVSLTPKGLEVETDDPAQVVSQLNAIEGIRLSDKDLDVDVEGYEVLLAQLSTIEGINLSEKEVDVDFETEGYSQLLRRLADVNGINVDDKTLEVGTEGHEKALSELKRVNSFEFDEDEKVIRRKDRAEDVPSTLGFVPGMGVRQTGWEDLADQIREIEEIDVSKKSVPVDTDGFADVRAQLERLDAFDLSGETLRINGDAEDALGALASVTGISIDDKVFSVDSDTERVLGELQALEGLSLSTKDLDVDADTAEALSELGLIESTDLGEKTVSVEARGYAQVFERLRAIEGLSVDDKLLDVDTEGYADAVAQIRALNRLDVEDETVNIYGDSEQALAELTTVEGIDLSDKDVDIDAEGFQQTLSEFATLDGFEINSKDVPITTDNFGETFARLSAVEGYDLGDKRFNVYARTYLDEAQQTLGDFTSDIDETERTIDLNTEVDRSAAERALSDLTDIDDQTLTQHVRRFRTETEGAERTLTERDDQSLGEKSIGVGVAADDAWAELTALETYTFDGKTIDVDVNRENLATTAETSVEVDTEAVGQQRIEADGPQPDGGGGRRGETHAEVIDRMRRSVREAHPEVLRPRSIERPEFEQSLLSDEFDFPSDTQQSNFNQFKFARQVREGHWATTPDMEQVAGAREVSVDMSAVEERAANVDVDRQQTFTDIESSPFRRATQQFVEDMHDALRIEELSPESFLADDVTREDVTEGRVEPREAFEFEGAAFDDIFENDREFEGIMSGFLDFDSFANRRDLGREQTVGSRISQKLKEFGYQLGQIDMGSFYRILAQLLPLLLVFIGAIPAAIAAVGALAVAAGAAAAALLAITGLGLLALASQRGGGTDWQSITEGFKSIIGELRDAFLEAFMPLAGRFDDLASFALDSIERLFNALAARGQILTQLKDDARGFINFVVDYVPDALAAFAQFGDAFGPLFGAFAEWLQNADMMASFAEVAAQVLPPFLQLLSLLPALVPLIIQMSIGFLRVATAITQLVVGFSWIMGILGPLQDEFWALVAVMLTLVTITAVVAQLHSLLAGSVFVQAMMAVYQYAAAIVLATVDMYGYAAATAVALSLTIALVGVLTLGIGVVAGLGSAFMGTSAAIDEATSSLKNFGSVKSGMGGMGMGGMTAPGEGLPRGSLGQTQQTTNVYNTNNSTEVKVEGDSKDTDTARLANKLGYVQSTMGGPT